MHYLEVPGKEENINSLELSIELVESTSLNDKDLNHIAEFGKSSRSNKIAVGLTYSNKIDLSAAFSAIEKERYSLKLGNDYELQTIVLSCSFQPDPSCKIQWARFGISLFTEDSKLAKSAAFALDIFPQEVTVEQKTSKRFSVNPSLKLNILDTESEVQVGDRSQESQTTSYEPKIFSFGINQEQVGWDFYSTSDHGIFGDKRNLILLVKKKKGQTLKGQINVSAEVNFGKFLGLPFTSKVRRKKNIISLESTLT